MKILSASYWRIFRRDGNDGGILEEIKADNYVNFCSTRQLIEEIISERDENDRGLLVEEIKAGENVTASCRRNNIIRKRRKWWRAIGRKPKDILLSASS